MNPEHEASTTIRPAIVDETLRLLNLAEQQHIPIRALGGMAVAIRVGEKPAALQRAIEDIDLAAPQGHGRGVSEFLSQQGYVPNETFNALHGAHRMVFEDTTHGRHIDLFIGRFQMCHELRFDDRLPIDRLTLPLAELAMTKLQIVNLTAKDVSDLYALLLSYEVTDHDRDAVNGEQIAALCARDWGTYRTFQGNLERLRTLIAEYALNEEQRQTLRIRIGEVEQRMQRAPKSAKWRMRARVGDRVRWYADPEEVEHPGQDD
jgi:hypothetical protein